jgi:hypothetical protein
MPGPVQFGQCRIEDRLPAYRHFRDGHPKVKDLAEVTFDPMCVLGVAE